MIYHIVHIEFHLCYQESTYINVCFLFFAFQSFKDVLKLDPNNFSALQNIGVIYHLQVRFGYECCDKFHKTTLDSGKAIFVYFLRKNQQIFCTDESLQLKVFNVLFYFQMIENIGTLQFFRHLPELYLFGQICPKL